MTQLPLSGKVAITLDAGPPRHCDVSEA